MHNTQKGFTLIELLVVIAIVAVLSVVVILTLNPAELLRQARDSNRISDLNTVHSALSLYLADVTTPVMGPTGYVSNCYMTVATTANCGSTFSSRTAIRATTSQEAAVNGNGWVPVNFNAITTQSPVSKLPVDPVNSGAYFYAYGASSTQYKMVANMESSKYSVGGGSDVESNSKDGGSVDAVFEVGTNLAL